MEDAWPRSRAYAWSSLALWLLFILLILALSWGSGAGQLPRVGLLLLALAAAGSVAVQFAIAYRLIAAQDEYVRAITAKRIVAAAGLTMTCAVLWGLAEQFLGVPDAPMWLIYPFFWGMFGIVTPLIRSSHP